MGAYIADFAMVAGLIIAITAFMGVFTNGVGVALFSKKQAGQFVDQSAKFQVGWKKVGGKQK